MMTTKMVTIEKRNLNLRYSTKDKLLDLQIKNPRTTKKIIIKKMRTLIRRLLSTTNKISHYCRILRIKKMNKKMRI